MKKMTKEMFKAYLENIKQVEDTKNYHFMIGVSKDELLSFLEDFILDNQKILSKHSMKYGAIDDYRVVIDLERHLEVLTMSETPLKQQFINIKNMIINVFCVNANDNKSFLELTQEEQNKIVSALNEIKIPLRKAQINQDISYFVKNHRYVEHSYEMPFCYIGEKHDIQRIFTK